MENVKTENRVFRRPNLGEIELIRIKNLEINDVFVFYGSSCRVVFKSPETVRFVVNENHSEMLPSKSNQIVQYSGKSVSPYKKGQIIQLSIHGDEIAVYNSIKIAAKKLKIDPVNIGRTIKGLRKSAGGFKWKRREE